MEVPVVRPFLFSLFAENVDYMFGIPARLFNNPPGSGRTWDDRRINQISHDARCNVGLLTDLLGSKFENPRKQEMVVKCTAVAF